MMNDRSWEYPRKCKMCGAGIHYSKRSHIETCSPACRKQWSRRKESVKRSSLNIMRDLQALRRMLKQYGDLSDQINGDLRRIRGEIDDLLRLRPDEDQKALMEMQYDLARKRDTPA